MMRPGTMLAAMLVMLTAGATAHAKMEMRTFPLRPSRSLSQPPHSQQPRYRIADQRLSGIRVQMGPKLITLPSRAPRDDLFIIGG